MKLNHKNLIAAQSICCWLYLITFWAGIYFNIIFIFPLVIFGIGMFATIPFIIRLKTKEDKKAETERTERRKKEILNRLGY